MTKNNFSYKWTLKKANFSKDKGKVFSCFSCGGGSSMGYKLAGFDVIGCNDIDPKMMEIYKLNHNPKYSFLEGIQTFKEKKSLPEELYNLDILDGSPPCSSFSMAGNREKDWGKEKKFREGQSEQVLDTLFFDFIDLAKRLQPKVVIAENVKGLMLGSAKSYVRRIYKEFKNAGYNVQHWLLDAANMGVPQHRERVFFIALRDDLCEPYLYQKDFFTQAPYLNLKFKEPKIPFGEFEEGTGVERESVISEKRLYYWENADEKYNHYDKRTKGGDLYGFIKRCFPKNILPTIVATTGTSFNHFEVPLRLTKNELCYGGSFPTDYNFGENDYQYIIGMSVPPIMVAQIAQEIYKQWNNIFTKN